MFTCCNKQFSSKQSLAGHRRDNHGGISCDQCNKAFYSKRSLDSHKSRYHKQFTRKAPTYLFSQDTRVNDSGKPLGDVALPPLAETPTKTTLSDPDDVKNTTCLLIPVKGGDPVSVSIPKNLYNPPKCDMKFILACQNSGFGTTSEGTITLDGIDTQIDYGKFIQDCNVRCFKPKYECLYKRLHEQGYDFSDSL